MTTIKTTPLFMFYGQCLGDIAITASSPIPGSYRFLFPTARPGMGASSHAVCFTPEDPVHTSSVFDQFVIVHRTTPTLVDPPRVVTITYGDALSQVVITGSGTNPYTADKVPGTFTFSDSTLTSPVPITVGVHIYAMVFTPDDITHYTGVTIPHVSVTVDKIPVRFPQNVSIPTMSLEYGNMLGEAVFAAEQQCGGIQPVDKNGSPIPGKFFFNLPMTIPSAGTGSWLASYVPDDTDHYTTIPDLSISVITSKATPTIKSEPRIEGIVYGQNIRDATAVGTTAEAMSGSTVVPGSYVILPTTGKITGLGSFPFSVLFVPTDCVNYHEVRFDNIPVTVSKANPAINGSFTVEYGQSLAYAVFSGTTSVPGKFEVLARGPTPIVSSIPGTSVKDVWITFTPDNTTYHNTVTATYPVLVLQATPIPPDVSHISLSSVYGTPLSDATVTYNGTPGTYADRNVPGSFVFTNPSVVPNVGDHASMTFQPNDLKYFSSSPQFTVPTNITKGIPTAPNTRPTPDAIYYGANLSATVNLTFTQVGSYMGEGVPGSWQYVDPTAIPHPGDSANIVFVPDDTHNLESSPSESIRLNVRPAYPTPPPTDNLSVTITYGQSVANANITNSFS